MYVRFSTGLLAVVLCTAPAFANSWHAPNVYEESNGDYTNYTYDDGLCRYTYNYNQWEKHAQASRYGECAHLVIGPDGRVLRGESMPEPQ